VKCVLSARKGNWLRGGRCRPAARIAPRHNVRRHLGSGFLHGVGRHVLPVTPGGNPAWGYPRCCRQDQSRSGQDQIRSELLGQFHYSEQSNGWGTARFAQRGAGQQRPASMGKELGTWPTSQLPHISLFVRLCQVLFSLPSSPCLLRNASAFSSCLVLAPLLKSTNNPLSDFYPH